MTAPTPVPTTAPRETRDERLLRLRTNGFRKLREGKIHVRCYVCGRKMSNTAREQYDPPTAVLIETPCERCNAGKEPPTYYYDAAGVEVEEEDDYGDYDDEQHDADREADV